MLCTYLSLRHALQHPLQCRKPFEGGLKSGQHSISEVWKSSKLPGEAKEAFKAAQRVGVRQDVLTAAAKRFRAAQLPRK